MKKLVYKTINGHSVKCPSRGCVDCRIYKTAKRLTNGKGVLDFCLDNGIREPNESACLTFMNWWNAQVDLRNKIKLWNTL